VPEFYARFATSAGSVREETFIAESESALRHELERKDYYVLGVRRHAGVGQALGMKRFGRRRVKTQEFVLFNQELVTLLRAGLPLLGALDILLERMPEGTFRTSLQEVRDRVKAGDSLSEAFGAQGELFPRVYWSALTAGERSGELDQVIERYVIYVKKALEARRRMLQAVFYPFILLGVSSFVVGILLFYVIPRFVEIYSNFEADLPIYTRAVIGFSSLLVNHWGILLAAAAAAFVAYRVWQVTETGRVAADRWKLRLPIYGDISRKYALSQACRTLGTLLRGGIPLVTAMEVTSGSSGNRMVSRQLRLATTDVREGKPLWTSLEERATFATRLSVEMIKVGEATGALNSMLLNVSEFYDQELDVRITRLVTLFEPILLVVMGVLILFLLLSIYLPLFETVSAIKA
jgi:type IV pilus assembly protein PilC